MTAENTLKILWAHDQQLGPINGLAERNGEKVWFQRASGFQSDDDPIFNLYRLDSELLEKLEADHESYCKETGSPLKHGDPRIIRTVRMEQRMDLSSIPTGESVEVEPSLRALLNVKRYEFGYDPNWIQGEFIAAIPQSSFSNYYVPHRAIRNELTPLADTV